MQLTNENVVAKPLVNIWYENMFFSNTISYISFTTQNQCMLRSTPHIFTINNLNQSKTTLTQISTFVLALLERGAYVYVRYMYHRGVLGSLGGHVRHTSLWSRAQSIYHTSSKVRVTPSTTCWLYLTLYSLKLDSQLFILSGRTMVMNPVLY